MPGTFIDVQVDPTAGADPDLGPKSAVVVATFFDLPEMLALLRR